MAHGAVWTNRTKHCTLWYGTCDVDNWWSTDTVDDLKHSARQVWAEPLEHGTAETKLSQHQQIMVIKQVSVCLITSSLMTVVVSLIKSDQITTGLTMKATYFWISRHFSEQDHVSTRPLSVELQQSPHRSLNPSSLSNLSITEHFTWFLDCIARTTYVDTVYCYWPHSVVCWSVCHTTEPCKNSWTDGDAVWVVSSDWPKES